MTDKYGPQKRYAKKTTKRIPFSLNLNTDKDIIDFLETIDNKQGYIKKLIREDMKRQGK